MRILYLAHRIPYPPNKGDKIRSFHQIRHLSRQHAIHLLAFFDDPADRGHVAVLKEFCRDVELVPLHPWPQRIRAGVALLSGKPWTLGYFSTPLMKQAVCRQLRSQSFDLIFVYSSSMAPYVSDAAIPKVLDFVDSDASKWNQYAERKAWPVSALYGSEGRRLAGFELAMTRSFDASVFVSCREATHLEVPGVREKLKFIQNGVDLEFFRPQKPPASTATIVFTGAMDYYPNVDAVDYFANHVFPLVRRHAELARFLIVGSRPARRVQRLARLTGVEVTGTVPDTRPYLAQAAVAVAPLRIAQGIQNKILEALAMGIPVVATSKAAAGIQGLKDLSVTVADEPEDQAQHVLRMLSRGRLSHQEVARTRACLKEHYSWDHNMLAFENLFEQIVASRLATRLSG